MTRICAWRRRWSPLPALLDVLFSRAALVAGLVTVAWLLGHATAMASERVPDAGNAPAATRAALASEGVPGSAGPGPAPADIADRVRMSIASSEADAGQPDRSNGPDRPNAQPTAVPPSGPGEHRTADAVAAELDEHRERAQSQHRTTPEPANTDDDSTTTSAVEDERGKAPVPTQRPDIATTSKSPVERAPAEVPAGEPPAHTDLRSEIPPTSADEASTTSPTAQREHELPQPRAPNPAPLPLPEQLPASAVLSMTSSAPGANGLRGTLAIEPGAVGLRAPPQVRACHCAERPPRGVAPGGPTVSPD